MEMMYSVSIAFQLAGALLLVLKYWSDGSHRKQLKELQMRRTHVSDGTLCEGTYEMADFEFVKELWINRIAFVYISLGYITCIWSSTPDDRIRATAIVIVLTAIFIMIGELISSHESNKYR